MIIRFDLKAGNELVINGKWENTIENSSKNFSVEKYLNSPLFVLDLANQGRFGLMLLDFLLQPYFLWFYLQ